MQIVLVYKNECKVRFIGQNKCYNKIEEVATLNSAISIKADSYKTSFINNRRYLGNKYKLLPFITSVVNKECKDIKIVADVFAGTGAVIKPKRMDAKWLLQEYGL